MIQRSCVFCGAEGKLTGEHVFGDWLSRIGLEVPECQASAGPLNRSGRELGGRPFTQKVRDVCGPCNSGWMSRLESTAGRVLTPLILGQSGSISKEDTATVAAWVQKTALVGMLVSSKDARTRGYGLPSEEYRALYTLQHHGAPLPASRFWIGRYEGRQRLSSIWVTPMVVHFDGHAVPEFPQAYAVTVVLGKLIVHGVRFTSAEHEVILDMPVGFAKLWPNGEPVTWPTQTPIDDRRFIRLSKGLELVSEVAGVSLAPWRPAVDLERSTAVESLVQLPTPCGEHFVFYPMDLAVAGASGDHLTFMTSCECGKSYLVETENDGAHFKAEGTAEAVSAAYEELVGEEFAITDAAARFFFKRARSQSVPP